MARAAKWMVEDSAIQTPLPNVPTGVEVYPRYGAHGVVYILINFAKQTQTVMLPAAMNDVLQGGTKQSIELPTYGVAVLSAGQ
jgi:beta-galactosidase GanA